MPRRSRATDEEGREEEEREHEPEAEAQDALAQVATSGKRQPETRIHRVNPDDGEEEFIFKAPPALVDESWLQKKFGPGKYIMHTYACVGPKGRFQYVRDSRRTIVVGKGADDAAPPATPAQPGSMEILAQNQIVNLIREQNETRNTGMTMLVSMMQQGQAQQAAAAQQSQQFMQMMMTLVTAMMNQPKPESGLKELLPLITSRPDPVAIATQLAGLLKPDGPRESMVDMIRALGEVQELRGLLTGEGGGDEDSGAKWFRLIEKSLPGVLDLLNKESAKTGVPPMEIARRPAATVAAPPPAAALPPSPPAPETAAVPAAPADEWTPLEPHMARLLDAAMKGKKVRYVAAMILLAANEEQTATLREVVASPEAADRIVERFPGFAQRRAWLDELLDELYAEFNPDAEGDDAPGDDDPTSEEPQS